MTKTVDILHIRSCVTEFTIPIITFFSLVIDSIFYPQNNLMKLFYAGKTKQNNDLWHFENHATTGERNCKSLFVSSVN